MAGEFLGDRGSEQTGGNIDRYQQDFRAIEQFSHLKKLI
jgi:hypothetical protein